VVLAAQLGARGLCLQQLRELLQREAQEVLEPHDLSHSLHIRLGIPAVLTVGSLGPSQ
jgi:hypothetical protein